MLGKYDLMAFVPAVLASDDYGVTYDVNGRRLRLSFVPELKPAPFVS